MKTAVGMFLFIMGCLFLVFQTIKLPIDIYLQKNFLGIGMVLIISGFVAITMGVKESGCGAK